MQKILLSLFLLYSGLCFSQNWCPPGAQWTYVYGGYCYGGYSRLNYVKDTIVLSQPCKKITETTITTGCFSTGIDTSYLPSIYTYSQNDTVFFLRDGLFRPYYFYTAKVGDTLTIYNQECNSDTLLHQLVDSTGTVVLNNDSLRFYTTHNINTISNYVYPKKLLVIEKIGAVDNYMIPYFPCHTDATGYSIRCYQSDVFLSYNFTPKVKCDYIYTETTNLPEYSITITPNPAFNMLTINSNNNYKVEKVEIFNISGSLTYSTINSQTNELMKIDVNMLKTGMYFITIQTTDGKSFTKKFIKE